MKATPVNLDLPWGIMEGLHWSRPGAPRILCLHGWLDNAASFVPLAPYLESFDVLALDFAGHGFSAHRPKTSRYYFTENLFDIDQALQILGWDQCHLVGHSMGAGLACSFAAAMPESVSRLVLLDAVGIYTQTAKRAARQLRLSLQSVRKQRSFLRPYETVEDAMAARQKSAALSDDAARLLCERALEHTGDYYQWRTDPGLTWRSPQLPGNKQALNLLREIKAPTLVLTSPVVERHLGKKMLHKRLAAISDCHHVRVAGGHHFHMEQPGLTGKVIHDFLLDQQTSTET